MANTEKKECLVCGKLFTPCNSCKALNAVFYGEENEEYQWRRVVCCPEHFYYHLPIIDYVRGKIDKAIAKERLEDAIKTYGKIEFRENIKPIANEILSEPKVEETKVEEKKTANKVDKKIK